MPLPVVLELFDCGEMGLETPVSNSDNIKSLSFVNYYRDAMPMVEVPNETVLEDLITKYREEYNNVDFQFSSVVERPLSNLSGNQQFDQYKISYNSMEAQPVYALTTGYLHYLHDQKSYDDLLSGANLNPGENILVLVTCDFVFDHWAFIHPGRTGVLEECTYSNFQMLNDDDLRALIKRSASEIIFKKLYKDIIGTDWPGAGDWDLEYLNNFKLYPEWPIVVNGSDIIALSRPNPELITEQLLLMSFKIDGIWNEHYDFVKSFFKYHQRSRCVSGHPLIAKLLGYSVDAGTIDIISSETTFGLWRVKHQIINDFENIYSQPDPEYHPLALDCDEDPNAVVIPRPVNISMPPNLELRGDQLLTRLKIFNPFGLEINIQGTIPNEVSISPISFFATEQVIEVRVSPDLPAVTTETIINIATTDGAEIMKLKFKYAEFKTFPVTFWNVVDNIITHDTQMTESKLREVISIANDILGSQTNLYIYPKEEFGKILTEFPYAGDLGYPITEDKLIKMSELISFSTKDNQINILFVWQAVTDTNPNIWGMNYTSGGRQLIEINTQNGPRTNLDLARTMVHELGHWFSTNFIYPANGGAFECAGNDRHFSHPQPGFEGCPNGDWRFFSNLMQQTGSFFITGEQAEVFDTYASQIQL